MAVDVDASVFWGITFDPWSVVEYLREKEAALFAMYFDDEEDDWEEDDLIENLTEFVKAPLEVWELQSWGERVCGVLAFKGSDRRTLTWGGGMPVELKHKTPTEEERELILQMARKLGIQDPELKQYVSCSVG